MMEQWPLFLFLAGLIAAWSLLIFKIVQVLLSKTEKRLEDKIDEGSRAITAYQCKVQDVERQVLELKATLPLDYVRREDFIRHEVTINAKLDRIYDRLQKRKEE